MKCFEEHLQMQGNTLLCILRYANYRTFPFKPMAFKRVLGGISWPRGLLQTAPEKTSKNRWKGEDKSQEMTRN